MPFLIENVKMLNENGVFSDFSFVAFDSNRILFCGHKRPEPRSLLPGEPAENWHFIDGKDLWLMPGMIDAHCHLGLFDDGLAAEGEDGNEDTEPVTPQLQSIDGLFHDDRCFSEALEAGVTSVMSGPGSTNVLAGRFGLFNTYGRSADDMAVVKCAAMKAALGENPKRSHGQGKDRSPATRMATASVLREALVKAAWYGSQKSKKSDKQEPDLRWEALLPALSGEMIFKFHAHRSDDIITAIRIADEFGLRYTIDHCTEGYLISDLLHEVWYRGQQDDMAGKGIAGHGKLLGIVAGPLMSDRSKPELGRAEPFNPARLADAGLPVAIMTDHPVIPVQFLAVSAAMAVKAGMPEDLALQAITSVAADLCDMGSRLGRIKKNYQADIILLDGHPFDYKSKIKMVWIDGNKVWQHV